MSAWPSLRTLDRLVDDVGLFEHARYSVPRRSHGYCTDDNGRGLAVVCSVGGGGAARLAATMLAFCDHAHIGRGHFHIRLGYDRRWTADPESDDANGRAILGLGHAAAHAPSSSLRRAAAFVFDDAARFRSPHWRSTASAVLGAAEVLARHPDHEPARALLEDAVDTLPRPVAGPWCWPEPSLRYENARLPHALIRLGECFDDERARSDGLSLLAWLIEQESDDQHFSFAPVGGRSAAPEPTAADQQPIEAWAMAEAALAAWRVDPADVFADAVRRAAGWFDGRNDQGVPVWDEATGAAYDGLEPAGVNLNQGAEAQLALLATKHTERSLRREQRRVRAA